MVEMIIIWGVVIAVALLIEFLTCDLVTCWFAAGGLVALILAACSVENIWWQVLTFFVVSLLCLIFLRRFCLKFIKVETTPTNLDVNIGKKVKLLKDVADGRSEIKVNDIIWTVVCGTELKAGDKVEIVDMSGNKYLVKAVTDDTAGADEKITGVIAENNKPKPIKTKDKKKEDKK